MSEEEIKEIKQGIASLPWGNLTAKELEKQYSPSMWSKRFSAEEIIAEHLKKTRSLSQMVRETIPGRFDVSYNKYKERTKLDVFGEDLPKDSYIMLYVHGGYWQELEKDVSLYPVAVLYKNQIMTVVVGYTLAPQASLSDIIEEIRESVEWACSLARNRHSKGVILMGWSAGAHLITEVLSTASAKMKDTCDCIRGIITLGGVFDLRPLVTTYVNEPLHLTMDLAWSLSPLNKVRSLYENFPSSEVLVAWGEHETPEFIRQSKQYCQALNDAGMKTKHVEIVNADHFNLVEDLSLENYELSLKIIDFITSF